MKDLILKSIKDVLEEHGVRKHINENGFGYSKIERRLADVITSQIESINSLPNQEHCNMNYRYLIKKMHVTLTADGEIDDWSYSVFGDPFIFIRAAEIVLDRIRDDRHKYFIAREVFVNNKWVEVWRSDQDHGTCEACDGSGVVEGDHIDVKPCMNCQTT